MFRATKPSDLVTYKAPEVGFLNTYAPQETEAALFAICIDYFGFCNVKEIMDADQCRELVRLMIEEHGSLRLADFQYFFRMCKLGKFGSNYNRIDGPTILQWLESFHKELDVAIDDKRAEEERRIKEESPDIMAEYAEQCPEELERSINLKLFNKYMTDAEIAAEKEAESKKSKIRNRIIRENKVLYLTLPVYEADKKVDELIQQELKKQNLL